MNSISNISSLLFLRFLCKKSVHLQRHILYCIPCSSFPWAIGGLELKLGFMAGHCPWLRLLQGNSNSAHCSRVCSWDTVKVLVQSVLQAEPPASQTQQTHLASVRVSGDKSWRQDQVHTRHSLLHALWTCSLLLFVTGVICESGSRFSTLSFSASACLRWGMLTLHLAMLLLLSWLWGHCPGQTLNVSPSP